MTPQQTRATRALGTAIAGALIVALTVWAHVAFVNGTALTMGRDPMAPSLPLTKLNLLIDPVWRAALLVPPLWLLAMLSGPWPLRVFSALTLLGGWYWVAESQATRFAPHFGSTWHSGEAFNELFYHSPQTPALMALSLLAYLALLSRLNSRA